MVNVTVGIDIGGTNTVFGFIDESGNCLFEDRISTGDYEKPEAFVIAISKRIKSAAESNFFNLTGIGIGAPNANYYSGAIEDAPNLQWKGRIYISDLFRKHFDVLVALTNDANAAALGEMIYGAAKGMKDFIVITLGTGLGSGIVSNGKLVYGHDGHAGELGHTIVDHDGRLCGCGRKGCLETYASATGIVTTVIQMLEGSDRPSVLADINESEISSELIYKAAEKGDEIALAAFEYTGKILGRKLADTIALTSPEAIFLYGGLANAGKYIFAPTQYHIEKNLLNVFRNKVRLLQSGLIDRNAAVLGAAAIAVSMTDNLGS
ncbi:MAG: ROK family protein [Candidatus Kapabacteria bacterium]|jgi:glucokinase|nr:ROK family protein [Candidatus Kapabacteria bacterium]